jgi:hypothetical protein
VLGGRYLQGGRGSDVHLTNRQRRDARGGEKPETKANNEHEEES